MITKVSETIAGLLSKFRSPDTGSKRAPAPWTDIMRNQAGEWQERRRAAVDGARVLMATSLGGYDLGAMLESALAVALTMRGANVEILLCDQVLPACQLTKIQSVPPGVLLASRPQPRCQSCYAYGQSVFAPLDLKIHTYSGQLDSEHSASARQIAATTPFQEIASYQLDGLQVGEHAWAGALRYFARGDLDGELEGEALLRRYLEASILSVFAMQQLLRTHRYDVACFHHGIYVPQGLLGEVCRQQGVRVVNWNPAYKRHTFIFSHGQTYHHTMIEEPAAAWKGMAWKPRHEEATLDYLKSRWSGSQDWIWFHENPVENAKSIAEEIGVDFSKPCIGMLTNVMWDAQLHYRSNAFANMMEWVVETIRYFERRPEVQLVIRIHPAEVRGFTPSRQPLAAEIERLFPRLAANIIVIPPESRVSTYAVMEKCDSVLIYNTKAGIEISSMGIPVVVAGEAWIRNKGFSLDADTPEDYFAILDQLPLREKLTPEKLELARKYAFHFFFRRMIPLPFVQSFDKSEASLELSSLDELQEGRISGLDLMCNGILNESPFIYPAEDLQ